MQAQAVQFDAGTAGNAPITARRTPGRFWLFIGDRLTRSRLRFTAASTIVVASLLLAMSFATTSNNRTANGRGLGSDYLAFYDAGTILNQHGLDRLYDLNLQSQLYHANLPGEPEHVSLPYANAPFFAALLRPLAMLPYSWSYAAWLSVSLMLFAMAFALVWKTPSICRADDSRHRMLPWWRRPVASSRNSAERSHRRARRGRSSAFPPA